MDIRRAVLSGDGTFIQVKFSITDSSVWRSVKESVKSLRGRKFNPDKKVWEVPLSEESLDLLVRLNFSLDDKLINILDRLKFRPWNAVETEVPGFGKDLYPFQKKGIGFLEKKEGRALIADEMGLGKTLQALGWISLHPELRPVVIVCPASVKLKWEREIKECMHRSAQVLSGTSPTKIENDIVIINYDILGPWLDTLISIDPKVVVLDECHYVKNRRTKRASNVSVLTSGRTVTGLSGTPVMNSPRESFNIIRTIDKNVFPNFRSFENMYCFDDDSLLELHRKLINSVMIRRLKKDVLSELPDKVRGTVPIEVDHGSMQEYLAIEDEMDEIIRDFFRQGYDNYFDVPPKERGAVLKKLNEMRVKSGEIKLPGIVEWIEDFLECDGKLVVFAHHRKIVEEIHRSFPCSVAFYGGTDMNKREKAVEAFQNDPSVRLFVGNINAAGIGIDLTAASNVAFAELPWTPAHLVQAEDRCHRIGQKKSVNVFYLLASGTIDDRMMEILDKKQRIVDAVLDGKGSNNTTIMDELVGFYWERRRAA